MTGCGTTKAFGFAGDIAEPREVAHLSFVELSFLLAFLYCSIRLQAAEAKIVIGR